MKKPSFDLYIQLRPRPHSFQKCFTMIQELLIRHDQAVVDLVGISRDSRQIGLTFRIRVDQPGSPTEQTHSGFAFTKAVFESLFDYMPRYIGAPTDPEREEANDFLSRSLSEDLPAEALV